MKKVIVIACCVVLVSAAIVFHNALTSKVSIENILPQGAIVYVHISDVKKQVDEFKSSRLWKNIEGIDVAMLMEKSGASESAIDGYKDIKSKISGSLADAVIDEYFGKEVGIALYPVEIKDGSEIKAAELLSGIILVTRPKASADFIEFVSKALNKTGKKLDVSEKTYKGAKITAVKLNEDIEIAYAKIKGLWVVGIGKKAAHSCLDVAAKGAPSLAQDKGYVTTISNLPKETKTLAYANLELLVSRLRQFMNSAVENPKEVSGKNVESLTQSVNEAFDAYAGFKTFGYADLGTTGKIRKDKQLVCYDKSKLIPLFKSFYSLPPRKTDALKFVPSDAIAYSWSSFDAKAYWEYLKDSLEKDFNRAGEIYPLKDDLADVEKNTGINIDRDIIAAIDEEMGVFVADINLSGFFPVPEYVFFVKLKNKAAIERSVEALLKNFNVTLESEKYEDSDIKYLNLPFGETLQPSYCYLKGDYLLVSVGRKALKDSIDALNGKSKSLLENESFKAVNFGLADKNNNVSFVNTDLFLQRIKGVCDWGFGWLSLISQQCKESQRQAQESLAKLKDEVAKDEAKLEKLTADLEPLKKEAEDLLSNGADASLKEKELSELEESIGAKKETIGLNNEEIERLENVTLHKPPMADIDTSLVKLYLDEAVYPILDGLRWVKAVGTRTTYGAKTLETESFYKVE